MNAIQEALEPVLRDVSATTDVRLTIGDSDRSDQHGPYVWITASDGSATMVRSNLTDTVAERVAAVADLVQEIVIEELWARASNWPMCPAHRSTHPLQVAMTPAGPWWACPADRAAVSAVGDLRL